MGTSKGYIAPTRPEWSASKRSVSTFLRNRDSDSKAKAVSKFAEAMSTGTSSSSAFSSAAGNVLSFAKGIAANGLNNTLSLFGRDDLIGKEPDEILNALLDQFTNSGATIEDSLAADALSAAFDELNIVTPDDLAHIDLNILLREMITAFINFSFDLHYHEKIGQGRTPAETKEILVEIHKYIANTLHDKLTPAEIGKIDLSKLSGAALVSSMLHDAYTTCMDYYGDSST